MRGPEPLTLTLELARAAKADSAEAFVFAPQSYVLRGPGGGFHNATLPWNESLLSDLAAVRQPGRDPVVVQRLGERLRDFLSSTEWPVTASRFPLSTSGSNRLACTLYQTLLGGPAKPSPLTVCRPPP